MKYIKNVRTKQIRMLEIETSTEDLSYIIEGLICLFPQVEFLRFSTLHLRKDLIRLIDRFEYLSNASFLIKYLSSKPELSIRGVRRLTSGTFTCRLNRLLTDISTDEIHLWIGKQVRSFYSFISYLSSLLSFRYENLGGLFIFHHGKGTIGIDSLIIH